MIKVTRLNYRFLFGEGGLGLLLDDNLYDLLRGRHFLRWLFSGLVADKLDLQQRARSLLGEMLAQLELETGKIFGWGDYTFWSP